MQRSGAQTKDELMQQLWPDSFVEEANLTVNITRRDRVETYVRAPTSSFAA